MEFTRRSVLQAMSVAPFLSTSSVLGSIADSNSTKKLSFMEQIIQNQRQECPRFMEDVVAVFSNPVLFNLVGAQAASASGSEQTVLNRHNQGLEKRTIQTNRQLFLSNEKSVCMKRTALIRSVLNELRHKAGVVREWDFANVLGNTIKERFEDLYRTVHEVSKDATRPYNFIVASPEICAVFETATAGFSPNPSLASDFYESYVYYSGTINCRWRLFKDALFPRSEILLGYKGDGPYDAGYILCPRHIRSDGHLVFGDQMVDTGSYARIKVKNFIL